MEIRLDKADLNRAKRMLADCKNGFPKAFYRTLNKTAANTKTDMVTLVRDRYNFKAAAIRKRINVYRCPSYAALRATVRSVGPGIHLTDVAGTRQTKKGVTVDVKKSTGRHLIPHAFIAPGRTSKKKIVFIRDFVSGTRVVKSGGVMAKRYPISPIYASHPEVVYNTDENWPNVQKNADSRLKENFSHEVDVILKGIA